MAGRLRVGRSIYAAWVTGILAITGHAGAQTPPASPGAAKAGASPFAPGDLKRPIFNTTTSAYNIGDAQLNSAETVVAEVDGRSITLGSVADAIAQLPPAERNMPFSQLFPRVRTMLIQQQALVVQAHRQGLDNDATVRRKLQAARDRILGDAYLTRSVEATITEQDLLARYDRDYANKPGQEEVHLRLIMLPTEQAAADAIARLKSGMDFVTLARQVSRDPTAGNGGDLGWVRRMDVNPETAAVAFSLAPGSTTAFPVSTAGGWFVMKVEDRRQRPTPPFAAVRAQIRAVLAKERVPDAVREAMATATIRAYDVAGKEESDAKPSQ
jgi:peptidyl-prolyl cis-trans isomerase C